MIFLCCGLNKLLINKKHNAPSAHQNTALNNHASSCQNERVGEKNSRIMSIEQGAASIAPNRGFRTSLRCEKKLATAPGRMKIANRFQDARQPESAFHVRRQKKTHHNEEDKTADCPRPTLFMFHSFLLTLRLSNTFFASVAFSKIKPLRIPC